MKGTTRGLRRAWVTFWAVLFAMLLWSKCQGCAYDAHVTPMVPEGLPGALPSETVWFLDHPTGTCSAVAVEPHIALTAAHCALEAPTTLHRDDGGERRVADFLLDEQYDLAALVVVDAFPVWGELALEPPKLGSVVWVAGYGCPPSGWLAVRPGVMWAKYLDGQYQLGTVVCTGDSGGPAWDGQGRVFGINVRTDTNEKRRPYAVAVPARVPR